MGYSVPLYHLEERNCLMSWLGVSLIKAPSKISWFVDLYQLFLDIVLPSLSSLEYLSADKPPENPESDNFLTPTCFIALTITTLHHR